MILLIIKSIILLAALFTSIKTVHTYISFYITRVPKESWEQIISIVLWTIFYVLSNI